MANFNDHHHHHLLFSSLISDIKDYTGKDPLLPWLRGIRKMKDSLPPHLLKEKLPRFLQKCAQTFQADRRYKNDLRYLRVWLHLMDFVDDPGAVLRTMEVNHVGRKRSLFYQAYALYYEKIKKFEEAEKMYHLGVNNLSEPIGELQTSFEQFLQRMEQHKKKRIQRQGGRTTNRPQFVESIFVNCDEDKENNENIGRTKHRPTGSCLKRSLHQTQPKMPMKESKTTELDETRNICGDDTVVVKFVDTAIVGRSAAEDACHHGLVEPTINTKEAMNAINSMFCEPLETSLVGRRRSHRTEPRADNTFKNGFEVFVDENLDNGIGPSNQHMKQGKKGPETHQPVQESFQIFIDDEENNDIKDTSHRKDNFDHSKVEKLTDENVNSLVFPNPKDLPSQCSEDIDVERPHGLRPREDTVVFRFVGSTISDEPVVENVCHHGLVEPTVNLKEAMDDINSMFGKSIEFTRKNRPKKQERAPDGKRARSGFLILPDNELHHQQRKLQPSSSLRKESDLFEPTVCTKEAMNEINKMFGMPLDF